MELLLYLILSVGFGAHTLIHTYDTIQATKVFVALVWATCWPIILCCWVYNVLFTDQH